MALRAHAVVMHDTHASIKLPDGLQAVPMRELAVIVEEGEFKAMDSTPEDVAQHMKVVDSLFKLDAVLPLPVGTVFKSPDVVQRWMELHYVALSDALAWVEDRVGARVHITGREREMSRKTGDAGASADLESIAAEVARSLRRRAVASVPVKNEDFPGSVRSTAFLVERALWDEFAEGIADEQERHPLVSLKLSGPWPPYDFVRLQFGA